MAPGPSKAFTWQGKVLKFPGVTRAVELRARGARPQFRVLKIAPPLKPGAPLAVPEGSFGLIPAPGFPPHPAESEVVLASGSVVFGSFGVFAAAEGICVELMKLGDFIGFAIAKATG